ncbi:orotate phosphoribosyltransferase [Mesorhizobium sp. YIM 152430]|uniref:orotate phosphoribosyltransferase n=1 Tax=Mesorhizobium sp. YIM 152430 TaxID=3031761 RepID=UPI0023DA3BF5|nr:orotate phosphoribosyltransferase [Mesorhizobium sp. YIM 152430]MDF1600506.1 orotate phosphoribosyltransferase [Mesorhizobium sp. YIM 152430]
MQTEDVLGIFREAGAILEGHFILTSGLRSPVFLQKARVFMHADKTERLCRALAEKIRAEAGGIDYVVGPAVGGIIPAYETSRHLGVPAVWVEREGGVFKLRRFEIEKGARVVIVEDIVTTGLSIRETVDCLRELGAEIVAAACIVDRSAGKADVGVPLVALAEYEVPAYPADALPPELVALPAVKPGSRNI